MLTVVGGSESQTGKRKEREAARQGMTKLATVPIKSSEGMCEPPQLPQV
jgi:hypothetical protein